MFAVKGLYEGGDTVRINTADLPVAEPYEVVVAFLQPAPAADASTGTADEKELARRRAGFQRFMKYYKTLPADFDYKKELAEYRDERYGRIN